MPILNELDLSRVLTLGASTGGIEALTFVLKNLPGTIPPTLIAQHITVGFSKRFASRLNQLCPFAVKEADDGDELFPSRVLIAPGGQHMRVERVGDRANVRITNAEPVNLHGPSIDDLFGSVADVVGGNAVGVLLTGMGEDGAKGLLRLREAGAQTLAQDQASCVVYGMPKVAFQIGAVERVVSLPQMPAEILRALRLRRLS